MLEAWLLTFAKKKPELRTRGSNDLCAYDTDAGPMLYGGEESPDKGTECRDLLESECTPHELKE